MQSYQYQYGDKPLEGYTIQRAVGRGGFGEVYYALSDAGREVALKAVQAYEQIELRGIQQCMNLKNPHLVTIFDVKHAENGRPFVIMEYVSGPSLGDLIQDSPHGLGMAKAAFFLREICKGLSYLHDCGIVHRDLKPSNIFYDGGMVKIGDYGLSKAMNTSRYSNQTITVGTVHYMAPEVGAGKYDRSIDIYAMGVILYEMLTGQVPYVGASPAEILLKHLNSTPDLSGIDETFARVIRKAMAHNPEERYHTVQGLAEDVFGSEQVRQSMSQFSPQELSMYAEQVARKLGQNQNVGGQRACNNAPTPKVDSIEERLNAVRQHVEEVRSKIVEELQPDEEFKRLALQDTLIKKQRIVLSLIVAGVLSFGAGLFSGNDWNDIGGISALIFIMIIGGSGGIIVARYKLLRGMEPSIIRNWATAAVGLLSAGILSFVSWQDGPSEFQQLARGTFISMIVLVFADFWKLTDLYRKKRVDIAPALYMGIPAFVISLIFHGSPQVSFAAVAGICLYVQIIWPYLGPKAEIHKPGAVSSKPVSVPTAASWQQAAFTPPYTQAKSPTNGTYPVDVPYGISPFKRVWALILSAGCLIGFAGLQRFYVGKIGTGILWFFTGGLLGIGQLIDFVMIISGNFRDKQGRRLLVWENESPAMYANNKPEGLVYTNPAVNPQAETKSPASAVANAVATNPVPVYTPQTHPPTTVVIQDPSTKRSFLGWLCAFTGYILLLLGMLASVISVIRMPVELLPAIPDAGFQAEMNSFWGTPNWVIVINQLLFGIGFVTMMVALVLLIIARRRFGASHVIRAVIAIGCLILSLVVMNDTIARPEVVPLYQVEAGIYDPPDYQTTQAKSLVSQPIGAIIENQINKFAGDDMIGVLFFWIAGIVFFAWPPKRVPPQVITLDAANSETGKYKSLARRY